MLEEIRKRLIESDISSQDLRIVLEIIDEIEMNRVVKGNNKSLSVRSVHGRQMASKKRIVTG